MGDAAGRTDRLETALKDAESELSRRLREACEAEERGVSTESTQEIRRLEDALLGAAVAAKQTRLLRRHIRNGPPADRERAIESVDRADEPRGDLEAAADVRAPRGDDEGPEGQRSSGPHTVVREFTDSEGRSWRAWQVTPRSALPGTTRRQFLGDFQEGWICFEALDSTARRRLASPQPQWADLPDTELRTLLHRAANAPIRKSHVSPHDDRMPGGAGG